MKYVNNYLRIATVYFLVCCMFFNLPQMAVWANPSGGVFTNGTGSITPVGDTMTIVTDQGRTSINWNSFNIGAPETVIFDQPSANATTINKIFQGSPSEIDGKLMGIVGGDINNVGGRILLINPAGVIFGNGSSVNATQVTAAALNLNDAQIASWAGGSDAPLVFDLSVNPGDYTVWDNAAPDNFTVKVNGDGIFDGVTEGVLLLGRQIINSGTINMNGYVMMAAGDQITITNPVSPNISVAIDAGGIANTIDNQSSITAGGKVLLAASGDIFSAALTAGSDLVLQGDTTVEAGTKLSAGNDIILDSGMTLTGTDSLTLEATSGSISGGTIGVTGGSLTLIQAADIALSTLDFSNQADTELSLHSTGGSVTADAAKAENAADKWSSIVAKADGGDVTLTGFDPARNINIAANGTPDGVTALEASGNITVTDPDGINIAVDAAALGGDIEVGGQVTLTGNVAMDASDEILLGSGVDGAYDLTLTSANGSDVANRIGSAVKDLTVNTGSLTAGEIDITGNLTAANADVTTDTAGIAVDGAIASNQDVTSTTQIDAGSTDVTGALTAQGGDITVAGHMGAGSVSATGDVLAGSATVGSTTWAGGRVDITNAASFGGNVTANAGNIEVGGQVTLTGDVTMDASSQILLGSGVDGAYDLTLTSVNGSDVANRIGSAVKDLTVNTGSLTAGEIDITGNLTAANADVTTDTAGIAVAGAIESNQKVTSKTQIDAGSTDVTGALTAQGGDITVAGHMGAGSVSATGDVLAGSATVGSTTWAGGRVDITNAASFGGNVTANAGNIEVGGQVTLTGNVAMNAGDTITFNDNATSTNGTMTLTAKNNVNVKGLESVDMMAITATDGAITQTGVDPIKVNGGDAQLTMTQKDDIGLDAFTFANQNNTQINLTNSGSITADGTKAANAADQWKTVTADAGGDITLKGANVGRGITVDTLTSGGRILVEDTSGGIIANGMIKTTGANGGNIELLAQNDIQLLGAVDATDNGATGGVKIVSDSGYIWTELIDGKESLNVAVSGYSDESANLGVDLPDGGGLAAVVIQSKLQDLRLGNNAVITASGEYDSTADNRPDVRFQNDGDSIDIAILLASYNYSDSGNMDGGNIFVNSSGLSAIKSDHPQSTVVFDAHKNIEFGPAFETYLNGVPDIHRMEVVSRYTITLADALNPNKLPRVSDLINKKDFWGNRSGGMQYILRGDDPARVLGLADNPEVPVVTVENVDPAFSSDPVDVQELLEWAETYFPNAFKIYFDKAAGPEYYEVSWIPTDVPLKSLLALRDLEKVITDYKAPVAVLQTLLSQASEDLPLGPEMTASQIQQLALATQGEIDDQTLAFIAAIEESILIQTATSGDYAELGFTTEDVKGYFATLLLDPVKNDNENVATLLGDFIDGMLNSNPL